MNCTTKLRHIKARKLQETQTLSQNTLNSSLFACKDRTNLPPGGHIGFRLTALYTSLFLDFFLNYVTRG